MGTSASREQREAEERLKRLGPPFPIRAHLAPALLSAVTTSLAPEQSFSVSVAPRLPVRELIDEVSKLVGVTRGQLVAWDYAFGHADTQLDEAWTLERAGIVDAGHPVLFDVATAATRPEGGVTTSKGAIRGAPPGYDTGGVGASGYRVAVAGFSRGMGDAPTALPDTYAGAEKPSAPEQRLVKTDAGVAGARRPDAGGVARDDAPVDGDDSDRRREAKSGTAVTVHGLVSFGSPGDSVSVSAEVGRDWSISDVARSILRCAEESDPARRDKFTWVEGNWRVYSYEFGFRDERYDDLSATLDGLDIQNGAKLLVEEIPEHEQRLLSSVVRTDLGAAADGKLMGTFGGDLSATAAEALSHDLGLASGFGAGSGGHAYDALNGLDAAYAAFSTNYASSLMSSCLFSDGGNVAPPSFVTYGSRVTESLAPMKLGEMTGDDWTFELGQCLDAFIAPEVLAGDNQWRCPKCDKPRDAQKSMRIVRLPGILIVQLNRFTFRAGYRDKLCSLVRFPLSGLSLDPAIGDGAAGNVYDLFAVANHFGTAGGGHYTAYVNVGSASSGGSCTWLHFDDSRVSEVAESEVVSPAAYILFYVRRPASATSSAGRAPSPVPAAREEGDGPGGGWDCGRCTFHNVHVDAPVCEMCGSDRDGGAGGAPSDADVRTAAAQRWTVDDASGARWRSEWARLWRAGARRGLVNLGNTCYMNAALQCLTAAPPLRQYLRATGRVAKDSKAAAKARAARIESVAKATGRAAPSEHDQDSTLLQAFTEAFAALDRAGRPFEAGTLKEAIGSLAEQFKGNDQHDAQELIVFLLAALHEQLNRATEGLVGPIDTDALPDKRPQTVAAASWARFERTNDSAVSRLFNGQLESELRCTFCRHTSRRYDAFLTLPLPLPSPSG